MTKYPTQEGFTNKEVYLALSVEDLKGKAWLG